MKSHDLYKIGKAKNVENRLKEFQCGNPHIEYVKSIEGNYESYLHKYYKDKRVRGEWFQLLPEDINNIEEVVKEAHTIALEIANDIADEDRKDAISGCNCERMYYVSMIILKNTCVLPREYDARKAGTYDHEVWYKGEILSGCISHAGTRHIIKLIDGEDGWPVIESNRVYEYNNETGSYDKVVKDDTAQSQTLLPK